MTQIDLEIHSSCARWKASRCAATERKVLFERAIRQRVKDAASDSALDAENMVQ